LKQIPRWAEGRLIGVVCLDYIPTTPCACVGGDSTGKRTPTDKDQWPLAAPQLGVVNQQIELIRQHRRAQQSPCYGRCVVKEVLRLILIIARVPVRLTQIVFTARAQTWWTLAALLLQPPTKQQREWTEAFGLAWVWTDILYGSEYKIEVIRTGHEEL